MAEMSLYPENLKGLELSFDEMIYTIAFGLEDEIRVHGKEEVFKELGMSTAEMNEHVKYYLGDNNWMMYALQRVLGNLDSSASDEQRLPWTTLEKAFSEAVSKLRMVDATIWVSNARFRLVNSRILQATEQYDGNVAKRGGGSAESLYEQVQQLMAEVRFYDEKRDKALERIETLMAEIKQREDCPKHFGERTVESAVQVTNLDGSVKRFYWPYRSETVLQRLNLTTLRGIVEYFRDFDNFINGDSITLMEWSVVTTVLRENGLLAKGEMRVTLQDSVRELELSVRSTNCLERDGIVDMDVLVAEFADGADEGWYEMKHIRNMGVKSQDEIRKTLGNTAIKIGDSLCFPTTESDVRALDFDRICLKKLNAYGIETIGRLLAVCRDENRFTGLRHVDNDLYRKAEKRLADYGFGN